MTALVANAGQGRWWRSRTVRRFTSHHLALLGVAMITLLTLACVFGPHLLPYDSLYIDLRARFSPPLTGHHYLGTDPLGRDLAARLLMAGRISLAVAFFAMLLSTLIGTLVGVIAGYRGGWIGAALMRTVDGFLSFPSIFLLLALAAALKPSPAMVTVIIAVTSWMEVARIVEAEVRSLREREFVLAGRMLGLSGAHIMFREILPNAMGPIIVAATLTVAHAILLEAYISFLGYGIQPPLASWGNMLEGAQQYLASAPWLAIIPGAAITIAVTSFNFIGDGLRDALDVRDDRV
ncbi:MAG: ABC transporter permease [Mesorhizobium sp.]|jgi:peptide/nickel transport system permease protein|uniref:ABC transporter permease n=1 Tax=unclassified Mesorhizobium TaxID=325217 RepID=UPI0007EDC9CF|nr:MULTISPECIES: ABC transporter permease [unclassified Mesorhizobium]RUV83070.1 ABC transporter permease [Mesorhizobium sp. M5C.F.Ca.IN.020.14.1.1]AZN96065.1 ABC transporter permease [Mesorhizobium sp. M9A.F.Ca.ET.002.03.1.2]QIA23556.1 ABC transporter permease [Mesorhizobium sp. AA22]RUV57773.1 ABC transporter permease [Mesorhizobium sp. M5C.F.Ca.IN.020.29.1.1]RWC40891.1 MAG: ABC transporter permease [Mesorhizobium sp.]